MVAGKGRDRAEDTVVCRYVYVFCMIVSFLWGIEYKIKSFSVPKKNPPMSFPTTPALLLLLLLLLLLPLYPARKDKSECASFMILS